MRTAGIVLGEFGARLRELRAAQRLTLSELGQRCGLSQYSVWSYESGRREPSYAAACRLADALGCSLDAFRAVKN